MATEHAIEPEQKTETNVSGPPHGVELVFRRNQFYFANYRLLCLILTLLFFIILFLGGIVIYQRVAWPQPRYFATTPDGRPIPIISLDIPYYDDTNVIINWAAKAVVNIYGLDFVTWRQTLQSSEEYFTPKGYLDFLTALKASTNLNAVKAKKQVVSAVITGPGVVTRQGQLTAELPYSWDIRMPATVTYQNSANEVIVQNGQMIMRIERGSLLRHKEGIAIAQLVFQAQ